MKIEIKNRFSGSVLFTHDEEEENTIKITLMAAVRTSANLRGANLRGAYLSGADLSRADLSGADLSSANLIGADLSGAYLGGANLSGANLIGANLIGADVDFSYGWKFACSCSRFKIGVKLAYQVLAHLSSCTSDDSEFEEIKKAILPYAEKSHRAADLGLINDDDGNKSDEK